MVRLGSRDRDSRGGSTDSKEQVMDGGGGASRKGTLSIVGRTKKAIYKKAKNKNQSPQKFGRGYSREIEIECFHEKEALNRLLYVY